MRPKLICVSGMVGVGKSTLSSQLAKEIGYHHIAEPVEDNPYLDRFYQNPSKWAYPMQEYLRARRAAAHQFAYWGVLHGAFKGVVIDRSVREDAIFADLNMEAANIDPLDWATYKLGMACALTNIPEPDVYLFLGVSIEKCLARIASRGRAAESSAAVDYFQALHTRYEQWAADSNTRLPLMRLDWSEFKSPAFVWQELLNGAGDWGGRAPIRPPGWWK